MTALAVLTLDCGFCPVMRRPSRDVQNEIWRAYRTADRTDAAIMRFVQRLLANRR